MSEVVKVTALGQTYKHQGKGFGPFRGTSDRPFLEVPLAVALASGAPVYTGEEAEEGAEEGADNQQLLDANASLKSDLEKVTAERDGLRAKLEEADSEISSLKLGAALDANTAALKSANQQVEAVTSATPLPDDFPMRALVLESGFDSLEKVRAGLVKPEGAEKSPVENVQGIGKKTLEAIEAALK